MKKITLLTSAVFLLAFSCHEDDKPQTPQSFQVVLIAKGDLHGNGAEKIPKQVIIISNNNDWLALINAMNTRNNVSNSFTETSIDFNRFRIIAAFDDIKPNGGHSIDITEVVETDDSIKVKVDNLKKGDATSIITQPFHIVKITKSAKPVVFL
jgi:hypothetical protein